MASRVTFVNQVKYVDDLLNVRELGVTHVTFNYLKKLHKMAIHLLEARAILRLKADEESSTLPLSTNFGVRAQSVRQVLRTAAQLRVRVEGIEFHVG